MNGLEPTEPTHHRTALDTTALPVVASVDFGARYRVLGVLGKGGMGEVYRAYDTELQTEVALKIVLDDHEAALARFRREIALAHKVTSPNVLRVHNLEEHRGLRFLSMEFVDGEDLAKIMRREGKLPLSRALTIFRQVCAGLAAAHAEGVVHRDLKPQNVLVAHDGRVRVADFGLARSLGDSGLTASGAVLGSPAYMSPEQVKGEPADARSDIYSLGVMLYQLVSGEPPFHAETPHALMEMRLHRKPRPIRALVADVPAHVERVIERCLALAPVQRHGSIEQLVADLDANTTRGRRRYLPFVIGGALAIVGIGAAAVALRPAPSAPVAREPTHTGPAKVVILGIENRTSDPAFDVVDMILDSALRRSSRLDPYSGAVLKRIAAEVDTTPAAIDASFAKRLADHAHCDVLVVHGTVVVKAPGYAFSIEATDATTGKVVFTQTLDAPAADRVVPMIGRLAAGLRASIGDKVPDAEAEETGVSPVLDADREFAQGDALLKTENDRDGAARLKQAIALDPDFARAHVSLGIAYENLGRPIEARDELTRAFALQDRLGERDRLKMLTDYYRFATGEPDRSIAVYQQILAKWPDDFIAEVNLGEAYRVRHDMKSALEVGIRAEHDHPGFEITRANLAAYKLNANDFDGAIAVVRDTLAAFPRGAPKLLLYVALASELLGHDHDATDAFARFAKADRSNGATAAADRALAEGRLDDARALLDRGIEDDRAAGIIDAVEIKQAMLAELLLRRGDKAGAIAAAAQVTTEPERRVAAALAQLGAGDDVHALATAAELADDIGIDSRAYAKLVLGEAQRIHGKLAAAIDLFRDSLRIDDGWRGHYLLARAELDAHKYPDAAKELAVCIARRGEIAIDINDVPSLRYIPELYYLLGLARDGAGDHAGARESFQQFIAFEEHADRDARVDDARSRAGLSAAGRTTQLKE